MFHVYPDIQVEYSFLSETEHGVLDEGIHKFKDYRALEIVEYMHEERAYKETESGRDYTVSFGVGDSGVVDNVWEYGSDKTRVSFIVHRMSIIRTR